MTFTSPHILIIGAGIGGLTTAALLLQAGMQVTVLESQNYPGGCAGTFFHKGYWFDAGATLAGGFGPDEPYTRVGELLNLQWPIRLADPAWVVHLPGQTIIQYNQREEWAAERQRHFPGSEAFWNFQEKTADILWRLHAQYLPWPPESPGDCLALLSALQPSTLAAIPFLPLKLSQLLPSGTTPALRAFLDAQLHRSAQPPASMASALYACAALDLPRRGLYTPLGGMGVLSQTLVKWIMEHGGEVLFRQTVTRLQVKDNRVRRVYTRLGLELEPDGVIADLTPWRLAQLLGIETPAKIKSQMKNHVNAWGAFTLYLGLDQAILQKGTPAGLPAHHQVILDPQKPLEEGNSVFLSLSDPHDSHRAPTGMCTATLWTHTRVQPWWNSFENDFLRFTAKREEYTQRLLAAASQAIPNLRQAVRLSLPGTPIDFQTFTGRPQGWIGGFTQTSLLRASGPQCGLDNLYRVGDDVFPGQSTAGVMLGAMRATASLLAARQGSDQVSVFPSPRGKWQTALLHPDSTSN